MLLFDMPKGFKVRFTPCEDGIYWHLSRATGEHVNGGISRDREAAEQDAARYATLAWVRYTDTHDTDLLADLVNRGYTPRVDEVRRALAWDLGYAGSAGEHSRR